MIAPSGSKDASVHLEFTPRRENKYNDCLAQKYDKRRIEDLMNMYFGQDTDGSYFPNSYERTVLTRARKTMNESWRIRNEGKPTGRESKKKRGRSEEHLYLTGQTIYLDSSLAHSYSNGDEGYLTPKEYEGDVESSVGGFSLTSLALNEINPNDSSDCEMDVAGVSNSKELNGKGSFPDNYCRSKTSDKNQMLPVTENENEATKILPDNIHIHASQRIIQMSPINSENENTSMNKNEKIHDNTADQSDINEMSIKNININDHNTLERSPSMTESSVSTTSGLSSSIILMDKTPSPSRINSRTTTKSRSGYYAHVAAQKTARLRRTRDTGSTTHNINIPRPPKYNSTRSKLNRNGEKHNQNDTTITKDNDSTEESDLESHSYSIVKELESLSPQSINHHPLLMDTQSFAGYSYAAHSYTAHSHAGAVSYDPSSYNGDHVDGPTSSHKDDGMSIGSWNTNAAFTIASGTSFHTANTSIAELKAKKRNIEHAYTSIQDRIGPLIHSPISDELEEDEDEASNERA